MSSEKVSIIIPVYNVEKYLAECLDSALRQDYENIEIIAINDGSTDASLSILEEFHAKHQNIIVKSIPNQGLSVARNTGLEIATGEYILFLDSDDFIEKHTISTCLGHLKQHQTDIIFFSANVFLDGISEEIGRKFRTERTPTLQNKSCPARSFFAQSININNYQVSACFYVYKKNRLDSIKFHPGILYEDNLFTTRLLLENEKIKVTCITDKLYNRRVRPESIMTQKKHEKHVDGFFVIAEELLKLKLAKEKSETGAALNYFIQSLLSNASITYRLIYGDRLPYRTRKKLIILLSKTKPIKIKSIALYAFPELITIRNLLRKPSIIKKSEPPKALQNSAPKDHQKMQ
ncbi:glycosyltransferase family 2 protein [Azotobacter beijerinckii]|uniref:Glycosyltransferase involved in cell wall bisynthesis n=1 Tax=Azotobacter beijerinckii TaxID=170623 RepID=A0A1I4BLV5_9GAMM|nr:glycosyltransferase family 2 protein [Azotobacter beijerinckii]SFB11050.1 Glycosyltransferase involved in cell wall bisynthesis [Azotobacter beijerinckii]SFK69705.1 Glycosyltransferase involved in cell wall bisynthesis [Azotobacter beijerinckii]